MAIQSGQTALASDFVAVSSGAPDAGKVPKLGADGKLHGAFLKTLFPMVAGEALAVSGNPMPVVVGLVSNSETISQRTGTDPIKCGDTANNRGGVAQGFTTPAGGMSVVQVKLTVRKYGSITGNFIIAIQGTTAGHPSGVDLVSTTLATGSMTASFFEYSFNLSVNLAANTLYWIVCNRSTSQSGSECFEIAYNTSDLLAGGNIWYYHNSNGWTSYTGDANFAVLEASVSGRIYQGRANNTDRLNFIGFLPAATAKGAAGDVYTRGQVLGGFSGLTPERLYYLQDNGTIGLSAGSNAVKVGVSLSATELLIL